MRRRLYFMLPDVAHAERALRELLLARWMFHPGARLKFQIF